MTERGIIFSTPMVRAILDGRKSMTRRVVKTRYPLEFCGGRGDSQDDPTQWGYGPCDPDGSWMMLRVGAYESFDLHEIRCPYGVPGDLLYCRETYFRLPPEHRPDDHHAHYIYKADWTDGTKDVKWKSGRFMPKVAARLWLKILDVRVQRVQEISEEDVVAEGIDIGKTPYPPEEYALRDFDVDFETAYRDLWNSLNAKRGYSWEQNPWVFALTFERAKGPAHEA